MTNLKGFIVLNDTDVTTVVGGAIAAISSCCSDVDSKKNDSYSGDKAAD